MLVICEDEFERLDCTDLMELVEGVNDFTSRIINDTNINIDTSLANSSISPRAFDPH